MTAGEPGGGVSVTRFSDANGFLKRAGEFLAAREAEHNLIFGISSTLQAMPDAYGSAPPYLAVVESPEGGVVAAALRTPPHNLVLSEIAAPERSRAVDALVDAIARDGVEVPGVLAGRAVAAAFAAAWADRTGARARIGLRERIYRLTRVRAQPSVDGLMREARLGDRELLVSWLDAFWTEALGASDLADAAAAVDRWLRSGVRTMYLWEHEARPVSMAGTGGATPSGIRIGPVYTPPELRRRGYASALVAAASQAQLDAGRRFCFLFTDLANPTSNKIYQAIGYEPVSDVDEYRFDTASFESAVD